MVWVIMRRREVSSERRRSSCSSVSWIQHILSGQYFPFLRMCLVKMAAVIVSHKFCVAYVTKELKLDKYYRMDVFTMHQAITWTNVGMFSPIISPANVAVNSLAPGKFEWNFRHVIFKQILVIDDRGISCEIALIWKPQDLTDDKSTLVQVMAWCRQATSHYLSQCWPRSLSPYGAIRPQWVNAGKSEV